MDRPESFWRVVKGVVYALCTPLCTAVSDSKKQNVCCLWMISGTRDWSKNWVKFLEVIFVGGKKKGWTASKKKIRSNRLNLYFGKKTQLNLLNPIVENTSRWNDSNSHRRDDDWHDANLCSTWIKSWLSAWQDNLNNHIGRILHISWTTLNTCHARLCLMIHFVISLQLKSVELSIWQIGRFAVDKWKLSICPIVGTGTCPLVALTHWKFSQVSSIGRWLFNRPVDWSRSISMVDKITLTEKYDRYRRSIGLHSLKNTVDIDGR